MAKPQQDQPEKDNYLLLRASILALWVAMLDLWLGRHFHGGVGMPELSLLVGVPLGSLWCVGVIDFLVGKEARESVGETVKTYFRDFIKTHLSARVLCLLFLIGAVIAATFSTVSIASIAGVGDRRVALTPATGQQETVAATLSAGEAKDLHLWINPFATQYRLSITGFLPQVITVKPFVGTTVIPDRDLIQTPTVLLRPTLGSYVVLGSNGWFELYRKTGSGFSKIAEDQGTHAWFIGPRRNQSGELRSEWQLETKEQGLDERAAAKIMRRWRNPKPLAVDATGPGETICALVTNVDRNVVVGAVVGSIVKQAYIDLSLEDFRHDPVNLNSGQTGGDVCAQLDGGAS